MLVKETEIESCFIIEHKLFHDERGHFSVPYNNIDFEKQTGLKIEFIQDNQSFSFKNVIRGLHYQKGDFAQSKLVSCPFGHVIDVVVDLRPNSKTFGKHLTFELGGTKNTSIFVPKGCAHGFSVISQTALFQYKVDNPYNKESEGGIIYNDSDLQINWRVDNPMVSEKDLILPKFSSFSGI